MVTTNRDLQYTPASEAELDQMLSGHPPDHATALRNRSDFQQLGTNVTGVVWVPADGSSLIRPLVLVCREGDTQRLCSRYAQLREDLSPLSAWCHLVTSQFFESVDSLWPNVDLGGAEAAWTGVAVAEATLANERPLSKLRIQTCLATQTYAIARSLALWPRLDTPSVLKAFDSIHRICRDPVGRHERLRASFLPIWDCLAGLSVEDRGSALGLTPIVDAMRQLRNARYQRKKGEAYLLAASLHSVLPEAQEFASLDEQPAEARLRLFDRLILQLDSIAKHDPSGGNLRRHALGFLTGYLSTVAAGGAPSLSLIQAAVVKYPELLAWAYLAGSVGERVVWTSGFDGLGRLVSREMTRPLRLDEPPTCDFSLEEARAVMDSQLSDPLVRLRVKQSGFVTVSLFPGVNVPVPIDAAAQENTRHETRPTTPDRASQAERQPSSSVTADRAVGALLDALRPFLQREIRNVLREYEDERDRSGRHDRQRNKRRSPPDPQLPLPKK